MVAVLPDTGRMYVRRWDEPQTIRRFETPRQGMGAVSLLSKLEAAAEPTRPDVVRHVLAPFRQIRTRIGANRPLLAVQLLNGLLLVAETARRRPRALDIEALRTFEDAFQLLSQKERQLCGLTDIPPNTAALDARDLVRAMVAPDPYTGCMLHPTLLFRHAASRLYQEAHLEIEKNPQAYLPGLEPTEEPVGASSPRDVRFTPPNLARALVQKALELMPQRRRELTILDPACGSGVFLIEAIRELTDHAKSGTPRIKAVGYDISEISRYTTSFSLEYAAPRALGSRVVQSEIVRWDSLDHPWVHADIILMNPPFIPWERLSQRQREKVRNELGDTAQKRPDMAMAFVKKAVSSLAPGGVLGCVLPAPLLTTQSGLPWREWLSERGSLRLVGCFEGFKYFTTSVVETAFLIYKKEAPRERRPETLEVLISEEGSEDLALRALRVEAPTALDFKGVERFERPLAGLSPQDWRPLRQRMYEKRDYLAALPLPQVRDLFDIRQGVRLGHAVFLLAEAQYKQLPRKERHFFRPAAGGGSLRNGQLHKTEYAFYPYAGDGSPLIHTEEELHSKVPVYYSKYLVPVREVLASRSGFDTRWWELDRKRSWQTTLAPRLVSTYFGESGSFAFDESAEYVTVNGHAWFWHRDSVALSRDIQVPFEQTPALWAYLALLNSKAFEEIMSLFSVRLQGGQIRLEARFLSQVPLPDVTDEVNCPGRRVRRLVELGKAVHAGRLNAIASDLDDHVLGLYGLEKG